MTALEDVEPSDAEAIEAAAQGASSAEARAQQVHDRLEPLDLDLNDFVGTRLQACDNSDTYEADEYANVAESASPF